MNEFVNIFYRHVQWTNHYRHKDVIGMSLYFRLDLMKYEIIFLIINQTYAVGTQSNDFI